MAKIALLIAVGQFDSGDLASLPKSSADVDAMKEVLIDPELGGFKESDITVLKNPKKQRIEDAVYDLFDKGKRKKDDLLLFYFSGHGITDESGIFFFSTYETRKENGKLRPTTAVSSNWVHQWINQCPSKRIAIILDCCHSGAFAKGLSAKGTANALIKEQLGGEGRAILTAASATEYAWAKDEFDLSVYTYYLLEGVRTGKADQDGNDWLSMEELHEYAKNKISEAKLEMNPEFYPVRQGHKIHLFKTKIIDPKEKYRKEIQRYLIRGNIPSYVRSFLEELREELQISQAESQSIEQEVFAPIQKKQENLKKYEKALRGALAEEGSFDSDWIWEELRRIQERYELQDEEVEPIRQKIIPEIQQQQLQKERQAQEEYNNKLRQYEQEFSKAVEREYPLSSHARQQINSWQQSLGLRPEDIKRIEQPILAAKYQEKLKEEERRKEQEAERAKQQQQKQREQEEYNNKLQQYEQELSKAVEREYPLSSHARQQINSWQQYLELRPEDIQRIEQPILAAKNQEKLKEEKRRKEQEVERAKQLELQKQREKEDHQKRREEAQTRIDFFKRLQYINPPTWCVKAAIGSAYGIGGISALLALAIGVEWLKFSVRPLPTAIRAPVIVYARDGSIPLREPRTTSHVDMKRLQDFGPYLANAVVASEDSRYNWHVGVDPLGILRAVLINSRSGDLQQGASTVTQQVARSLFRDYIGIQDSLGQKLREAIVALKLETFYSKDDILLTYLNRVSLGADTSGFEDAAQYYFNKSAKELTLSEAATLVGILPAPNAFDFCGYGPNKLEAAEYRNRVIKRMLEMGKITPEEANRARRSTVQISPKVCEQQAKTIAPYFYSYVFQELESILGEGAAREGNYIIETQLDPRIQSQAESALRNSVNNAGSTFRFSQGAIVTLDSRNGAILAMVGGTDYKKSQFNRAVQAKRQPGSIFKIFAYTAAIQQGTPASKTYSCAPLTWQDFTYKPCRSGADISLDIATGLALSENPIALRVARDVGLNKVVAMAQRLGIKSSLDPVPGLVLGQSVVNVLEMTGAFGAIGNRGVWNPPHAISRILDSSDCSDRNDLKTCRVVYSFDQDPNANQRVLSTGVADEMTSLMRGVVTRGTGRSAAIGLGEAGKTGTTDKNVDLWFIGFIPNRQLVTGVWLGNDNNSPTSGSSAQAAQLWGNYMGRITR